MTDFIWREMVRWAVLMFVATWNRTKYSQSIPDAVRDAVTQGRMVSTAMGKEPQ